MSDSEKKQLSAEDWARSSRELGEILDRAVLRHKLEREALSPPPPPPKPAPQFKKERQWPWYVMQVVVFFAVLFGIEYATGFSKEFGGAPAVYAFLVTFAVTMTVSGLIRFARWCRGVFRNQNRSDHVPSEDQRLVGSLRLGSDRAEDVSRLRIGDNRR